MKKAKLVLVLLVVVSAMFFTTCTDININIGESKSASSDNYTSGNFTYQAKDVDKINIDWAVGNVNVKSSDSGELSVSEDKDDLTNSEKLHWYIEDKTLKIEFSESGFNFKHIFKSNKNLTVEVPSNADIEISTGVANINIDKVTMENVKIETGTGNTTLGLDKSKGAKLKFSTGLGKLIADEYTKSGDYYTFGGGSCNIEVSSGIGNLEIN